MAIGISGKLQDAAKLTSGAKIFAYAVGDPQRFGIVEFDQNGRAISLKRSQASPNRAMRCLASTSTIVRWRISRPRCGHRLKMSSVITDLNTFYLERDQPSVDILGRGVAWLDAGTHASLLEASNFVQAVEHRQGLMIACPEEIAYQHGYISAEHVAPDRAKYGRNRI